MLLACSSSSLGTSSRSSSSSDASKLIVRSLQHRRSWLLAVLDHLFLLYAYLGCG
jgi:hypothetical protein